MNRKLALAKIIAGTMLIIASAGLSTAFQERGAKAFQTSSKNQQFEVTQIASVSCNGDDLTKLHMTYYSHHDNTYPGNPNPNYDIASPSRLYQDAADKKGGDGNYETPVIVAIPVRYKNCLPANTRLYAPHLKKYLIVADECNTDLCKKHIVIDVWMYSTSKNDKSTVIQCQSDWTKNGDPESGRKWDVVIKPSPGQNVDPRPFFNPDTNECRTPNFN